MVRFRRETEARGAAIKARRDARWPTFEPVPCLDGRPPHRTVPLSFLIMLPILDPDHRCAAISHMHNDDSEKPFGQMVLLSRHGNSVSHHLPTEACNRVRSTRSRPHSPSPSGLTLGDAPAVQLHAGSKQLGNASWSCHAREPQHVLQLACVLSTPSYLSIRPADLGLSPLMMRTSAHRKFPSTNRLRTSRPQTQSLCQGPITSRLSAVLMDLPPDSVQEGETHHLSLLMTHISLS